MLSRRKRRPTPKDALRKNRVRSPTSYWMKKQGFSKKDLQYGKVPVTQIMGHPRQKKADVKALRPEKV